ncbi:MAG: hypothetical protein DDT25_01159 [Chloroflexi bacterium]|nr:hypothetical protein [Chloroflexota bacterium]
MYVWNREGNLSGLLIFANRSFLLWYSGGEWQGYAASNGSDGFNLFDTDGEWIGYLLDNSGDGFNLFTTSGKWSGFTT